MKVSIWITIIIILFAQCKKDEIPIDKRVDSDLLSQSVDMNADYKYQIFFDLETNSQTGLNVKTDWDLAFTSNLTSPQININSAKYMSVWNTGSTNFSDVPDVLLAEWKYDSPESITENTAFGDLWTTDVNAVYVLNRGYNPSGAHLGYFKCTVTLISSGSFEVRSADLNGDNETTAILNSDPNRNRVVYSYDSKGMVSFEPEKDNWDILFTQYTHIYPDSQTYLVNGLLINSFETLVAVDSVLDFVNISASDTLNIQFHNQLNRIGYDWKYYDFAAGSFIIIPNRNYLIKTSESRFFKLRLVDFYDQYGVKGSPTFEFQEL
jgi:hypothetical protein